VLARIIAPAQFGHAAIALIVVALSAVIGTAGVSAPLVQRAELTDRLVGSVSLLALLVSSFLTLITVALAEVVIDPLFGASTARLVLLASPAWILTALGSPSQALLQRQLRFGALAGIEVASVLASAITSVLLALADAGAAAIVAGSLVMLGGASVLSLLAAPPGIWRADPGAVRDVLGFVTPVTLSSLVYIGFRNIDYAILGARTNATALGYYWRGYQLGVGYQSKISRVMLRVSFPVYSRASGLDELQRVRTRIVRAHATVLVPLLGAFIVFAPVLVPWLFGAAWEPTVRPAQILAVAGMSDAIVTGVGPLMIAVGRPGALLRWNLLVLAIYAVMVFFLAPHGVNVVAAGVAIFGVLTVIGAQAALLRPYAGMTFRQLWGDIRAGVVAGGGVLVAGTLARMALERLDLPVAVLLILLSVACVVVYSALLWTLFPAAWNDLRTIAGKLGGRGRPESSPISAGT
jgi:O-antigen/teichoic acid export membrane protein